MAQSESSSPHSSSPGRALFYWLVVGIPLTWGVAQSVNAALPLFGGKSTYIPWVIGAPPAKPAASPAAGPQPSAAPAVAAPPTATPAPTAAATPTPAPTEMSTPAASPFSTAQPSATVAPIVAPAPPTT